VLYLGLEDVEGLLLLESLLLLGEVYFVSHQVYVVLINVVELVLAHQLLLIFLVEIWIL
jgi:hypothetical protein